MAAYENPSKQFLGRVSQSGRALRTFFDAELRSIDLTLARGRLMLHLLQSAGPVAQSELAELLEVEHPTVVRQLDALEELGHIERQPLPGDRRAKAIALTEEGNRVAARALALSDRVSDDLLKGVDPAELAIAEKVLERIGDNIARLSPIPAEAVRP